MPKPKAATKAINLRIEYEHEDLVREVIARIRTGGTGFRSALQALLKNETAAEFVPANELHARFAEVERQIRKEVDTADFLPAGEIEARFDALEARVRALEDRG